LSDLAFAITPASRGQAQRWYETPSASSSRTGVGELTVLLSPVRLYPEAPNLLNKTFLINLQLLGGSGSGGSSHRVIGLYTRRSHRIALIVG
jgi:hypothetical protein